MENVLGFSNIIVASNAASPISFQPQPAEHKDFDIVFCEGADRSKPTSLMLQELAKDEPDVQKIRREQAEGIKSRLCEIAGEVWGADHGAERFVDLLLQARLNCRDEAVLHQITSIAIIDPDLAPPILRLLQDHPRFVALSGALRTIDQWFRPFTFAYLARYFRCGTFGLIKPFENWPGQWEYLGSLPYRDQSKAYGRGWFGLNVMRAQDDAGLNLKPFEITLSGTCLLQHHRLGTEDRFDDSECVVFRSPLDCRRKMETLLQDIDRIEQIAAAGRERSLRERCWKHRAAQVTEFLSAKLAGSQGAEQVAPTQPAEFCLS
jgi:hypothetical protein